MGMKAVPVRMPWLAICSIALKRSFTAGDLGSKILFVVLESAKLVEKRTVANDLLFIA